MDTARSSDHEGAILAEAVRILPDVLDIAKIEDRFRDDVGPLVLESVWRYFIPKMLPQCNGPIEGVLEKLRNPMIFYAKKRKLNEWKFITRRADVLYRFALFKGNEGPSGPDRFGPQDEGETKFAAKVVRSLSSEIMEAGIHRTEAVIRLALAARRCVGVRPMAKSRAGPRFARLALEILEHYGDD